MRKLVGFEKSLLLNYRTSMHIMHYRRKELEEFCKLTARNGAEAWWRLLSDNGPSNMCNASSAYLMHLDAFCCDMGFCMYQRSVGNAFRMEEVVGKEMLLACQQDHQSVTLEREAVSFHFAQYKNCFVRSFRPSCTGLSSSAWRGCSIINNAYACSFTYGSWRTNRSTFRCPRARP